MLETAVNFELAIVVLGAIGAAIGAGIRSAPPWKGAVAFFGSVAVVLIAAAVFFTPNKFLLFVLGMVAFGAAGGALKLSGPQIASSFLGAFLLGGGTVMIVAGV